MANGTVTIDVIMDDGSVAKGVANLQGRFEGLGQKMKSAFSIGGAMAVAQKGIDLVTSAVKENISAAVQQSDQYSKLGIFMKNAMGSSQGEIDKVSTKLKHLADVSVYDPNDMINGFQRLSLAGVKSADDVMVGFTDMAAGLGTSSQGFSSFMNQFGQAISSGKLQWGDLSIMLDQAPEMVNAIAQSMGMTSAQFLVMAKNGGISTDKIMAALQGAGGAFEKFAGQASAPPKTIEAAMGGLQASLVGGIQQIIDLFKGDLLGTIVGLTNGISTVFNAIANMVRWFQAGGTAVDVLKSAIVAVTTALGAYVAITKTIAAVEAIKNTVLAISNGLALAQFVRTNALTVAEAANAAATMGASGAFGIFNAILSANPIGIVVVAIGALVAGLAYFFTKTETGRKAWANLMTSLQPAIQFMQGVATSAMNALGSALDFVSQKIGVFAGWLGGAITTGLSGLHVSAMRVVGVLTAFGAALLGVSGPIGIVIGLVAKFVTAFAQTGNVSSALQMVVESIVGMINSIGTLLPQIITAGTNLIIGLINGILVALPQIINVATQAVTTLTQGIITALPMITQAAVQLITVLTTALVTHLPQLITAGIGILNALINGIVLALPQVVTAITQVITSLTTALTAALPMIITAGLGILMALIQGLVTALPIIVPAVVQIIMALVNALIPLIPLIITAGIQILMALINGIITALPQLISAGIQLITALVQAIISILPLIIQAAIKIVIALVNGLIQALPQLISAGIKLITALAGAIVQLVPLLIKAGVTILTALVKGVLSVLGSLLNAGAKLISQLVSKIGSFAGSMLSKGAQLITSVISGIAGKIGSAVSKVASLGSQIVSKIGSFAGQMLSNGARLISSVASGIGNGIGGAVGKVSGLGHRIVSTVSGFAGSLVRAGSNLIAGFAQGIANGASRAISAAANMAKGAVSAVKDMLGIHSPSRVFRDEVGKFIPAGISVGISANADSVTAGMDAIKQRMLGYNFSPEAILGTGNMTISQQATIKTNTQSTLTADLTDSLGNSKLNQGMESKLDRLLEVLDNKDWNPTMVLDDGTLVGRTAPKTDRVLASISAIKDRGGATS